MRAVSGMSLQEFTEKRIVRHGKIAFIPLFPDGFASNQGFFSNVRFERNAGGEVMGLRVSGGGVRNLRFVKLATPLPD